MVKLRPKGPPARDPAAPTVAARPPAELKETVPRLMEQAPVLALVPEPSAVTIAAQTRTEPPATSDQVMPTVPAPASASQHREVHPQLLPAPTTAFAVAAPERRGGDPAGLEQWEAELLARARQHVAQRAVSASEARIEAALAKAAEEEEGRRRAAAELAQLRAEVTASPLPAMVYVND